MGEAMVTVSVENMQDSLAAEDIDNIEQRLEDTLKLKRATIMGFNKLAS